MKGPQTLLTIALALSPLAAAWPEWLPDVDSLVVRQDDGSSNSDGTTAQATKTADADTSSITDPPKTTASDGDDDSTSTKDGDQPETTNLNTGGLTKSDSDSDKSTGTKTDSDSTTKHKTFSAADGVGGVNMITPSALASTTLYRINDPDPITWVWNYTSLQGTPTAIDVMVSCSVASETWTLTQNMTFKETATFTWDTNKFQSEAVESPLVVEQYTLVIIDSDSSVSATAEAGYLAAFDTFQFGLYTSLPYKGLGEWQCVTCSAASGDLDRKAVGFAVSMSLITVFSFTWYVAGFAGLL
ncbi:hypothetical protein F4780DRAFT_777026 [Xylariomycetidae sp. FL0641]|nr:hypothetical protein F4780DRAFT_777026 [Xylariomycetidae sp. FL0641]